MLPCHAGCHAGCLTCRKSEQACDCVKSRDTTKQKEHMAATALADHTRTAPAQLLQLCRCLLDKVRHASAAAATDIITFTTVTLLTVVRCECAGRCVLCASPALLCAQSCLHCS